MNNKIINEKKLNESRKYFLGQNGNKKNKKKGGKIRV
jgi:hypothetical protein